MTRPDRARGERGVVLILVATGMLALLVVAALAIDLGAKRSNRRSDQAVSDLSALAAGYFLAGNGGTTVTFNPYLACRAALTSASTNVGAFAPTQDPVSVCGAFPTDASTSCTASTPPVEAVFSDARYTLTIRYPIPTSELTDGRFTSGTGLNDGTNRCERMRVSFGQTTATAFARVIGVNDQTTQASAVVRSSSSSTVHNVATLVLLERSNCGALYSGGQGTIILEPPSSLNPGWIQADSEGKGTCTSNENEGGRVVYAAGTGNSRIEVQPTSDGKPGIIGIYALTPSVNGRGGSVFTGPLASNGLSVQPVATDISSRRPVDLAYNPSSRDAITQLHARAWARVTAPPAGAHTLVSGAQCSEPGAIAGTVVYVSCNDFIAGAATSFPNATDVYFTGKVTVANNKSLSLPVAERVYVRGCIPTGSPPNGSVNCGNNATSNSNAYAISVSGTLLVNTASFAACPVYNPPANGALTHRIVEIATLGGPVVVGGSASIAMCQTTVYIGRSAATYGGPHQRASGGPNCSPDKPCPADSGTAWVDEGYMNVSGGNGLVYWSAPNRLAGSPTDTNPLEALALWGEGIRGSFLKGTGNSRTSGVFFLPNSNVAFQGQGDQSVPQNAQFFARSLTISGQGTLRMRPNPADAVKLTLPGGYSLIR